MRILITGARGFIGKNLTVRLNEQDNYDLLFFNRCDADDILQDQIDGADFIIHLAGENRPENEADYNVVNAQLTQLICKIVNSTGRNIPIIFTSSTQAENDNPYGKSKRIAEKALIQLAQETGNLVFIYRLPGVFGKWSRPNYNSVVATFCHNIANDLSIHIDDPSKELRLVYVDDVVTSFIRDLISARNGLQHVNILPEYSLSLDDLAKQIKAFKNCRTNLISEQVGSGITRCLYATYISFLPLTQFVYDLPQYRDERGVFVEMLKTKSSGQFSFFTAYPGVTRGGHYHHSKSEKFIIVKGNARFCFRHIVSGEQYTVIVSGEKHQVVETVPGWAHDITNIGQEELIVMLWVNEIFDRNMPDTIRCEV